MVKVVHNVAPLETLRSNSKYSKLKWVRRTVSNATTRFAITFLIFLFVATLIISSYDTFVIANKLNLTDSSLYTTYEPVSQSRYNNTFDRHPDAQTSKSRKLEGSASVKISFHRVISKFMNTAPPQSFNENDIRRHFDNDENNSHNTTMLVVIRNGYATFEHHFLKSRHGRASSVKYIVQRLLKDRMDRNGRMMPNVTFPVMVHDGHRPRVPMFGSARHWKHWTMLIPAPLGNQRGVMEGWGTPLEGWDSYVKRRITNLHARYPWRSKEDKALFRGALGMQSYKLGSCNWNNDRVCQRATKWSEVNRGVLYLVASKRGDLFDVGFTSHKTRPNAPQNAFIGAPSIVPNMPFEDFQKYKYLLNVGSNQGKFYCDPSALYALKLEIFIFANQLLIIALCTHVSISLL